MNKTVRAVVVAGSTLAVASAVVGSLAVAGASASGQPTAPVEVKNSSTEPVPVTVLNTPAVQPVSGTVNVGNLPGTQPVSGSVSVSNLPSTQPVSGSVSVSNLPSTQPVSGTVGLDPSNNVVTVGNDGSNAIPVEGRTDLIGEGTATFDPDGNLTSGTTAVFAGLDKVTGFVDVRKYHTIRYVVLVSCDTGSNPLLPPSINWKLEGSPLGFRSSDNYVLKSDSMSCTAGSETGVVDVPGPYVSLGAFVGTDIGPEDVTVMLFGSTV